ncbi:MAG TPA: DUF1559 domain-containing protein [Planctomycetaceae bacterium]|nr:DUF1559 domain-containing protein [Planctomycetaceae bacterium]
MQLARTSLIGQITIRTQLLIICSIFSSSCLSTTISAQEKTAETLSLAYIPRDAILVAAARPAELLSQPIFSKLKQAVDRQEGLRDLFGVSVNDVQQISSVFLPRESRQGIVTPGEGGMVIHLKADADQEAILKKWLRKPEQKEFAGQTYFTNPFRPQTCFFPDSRTIVVSNSEDNLRRFIIAGKLGATKASWAEAWDQVSGTHAALMLDIERLRPGLNAELQNGREARALAPLAPLWQHGVHVVGSATAGKEIELQILVICDESKGTAIVADTVKAAVILARNTLSSLRNASLRLRDEAAILELRAADLADEVLDGLKFEARGNVVSVSANVGAEAEDLIAWLLPAVSEARVAAKRTQSKNNLKQIGLAMHNYHDAYQHLPPAVVIGPDGKTPHSWRVAILPYLDQQKLYEAYRMDEPWDSEHNKKLLEQIPDQYRCPMDDDFTTNTSYFALVGKGTSFEGREGLKFSSFTDGLSNTLMVVESKRAVPWTKPEDIPIDLTKELPKFGGFYDQFEQSNDSGGFNVLLCDGAVKFISHELGLDILRRLIQRNDGQPVR